MRFSAALSIITISILSISGCASAPPGPAPIEARGSAGFSLAVGVLTLEQALAHLGPAQIDRRDGQGALLTWRRSECALTLVFTQDSAGRLRLADAAAAPEPPQACAGAR